MNKASFHDVLEQFEAIEANLLKLERLCGEIECLIPSGVNFGMDPIYEDRCRSVLDIAEHMPAIDGWKLKIELFDLDAIAQTRFDLAELMEPATEAGFESSLKEPSRQLREYRFRFNRKRRELARQAIDDAIAQIDRLISETRPISEAMERQELVPEPALSELRKHYKEITTLIGSSMPQPNRWNEMGRHLHFGQIGDFRDIEGADWPAAKSSLRENLYGQDDPTPVAIDDIGKLIESRPSGPIPIKLNWKRLSDEDFERLIYCLVASEPGYENAEWLTQTHAADRGRDLSAIRVTKDGLSGQLRSRVIIQCKHWLDRSISPPDIALLKEQMTLWEPPRVDVLIVATSGRFTADAVAVVEKQVQSDRALRIEMWPESHLEMLLAARPALIAEFGLR